MAKKILVVDDEPKIVQLARDYLEHAGFEVVTASTGNGALALTRTEKPDLIVLDLGLPEMDGLDVTRALRRDSNLPIIMLTARAEESDKLIGLELGADDYLTKPFSPKELVARARALFRRIDSVAAGDEIIRAADVTLDVPRLRVTVGT
jgi:two-component system alkaline phosphatase synthesis response regulator PhoP